MSLAPVEDPAFPCSSAPVGWCFVSLACRFQTDSAAFPSLFAHSSLESPFPHLESPSTCLASRRVPRAAPSSPFLVSLFADLALQVPE